MKPRITVVTIGVDDLERSLRFYRNGLGLQTDGIVGTEHEHGAVAFFRLQGGLTLALWPRESIAHAGVSAGPASPTEFVIVQNVASKAEVDTVMEQARNAGATIVNPAHETFWGGYAGYFQDPDRHLWEIAWNPLHRRGKASLVEHACFLMGKSEVLWVPRLVYCSGSEYSAFQIGQKL